MKRTTIGSVLVLALLAGCSATFRPWRLSELESGMDRDQVIRLLGEPDFSEITERSEWLYYTYRSDYNPPPATDDMRASEVSRRLEFGQQASRGTETSRYVVRLEDGKMTEYREVTDLEQTAPEPVGP